ncbi:MAG: outer membrane beta-barrel protein, partial [Caulobacteraceae bacterium]|nr:outer membrane beta-barrel protein [Caulobacteraceae bacterium]
MSATQARAADPPPPSPAPLALAPTPGRNWTGFYLGLHAGGAWGRDRWASGDGFLAEAAANGAFPGEGEPTGLLGGGQVGFNQQMGPWVAGVEASASASNLGGYAKCVMSDPAEPSSFACHNTVDSIVTLSGRLGRGWGDFLLYGKAGAARATGSSQMFPTLSTTRYTSRGTRSGWVLGGGLEYPISRTLSGFIEYDHYDFGAPGLTYSGGGQSATVRFNERLDAVRLGVNYHFAGSHGRDASPPLTLPGLLKGWTAEIGARDFADAGRMQFDLMDPVVTAHLNSRLIYSGATGQSLETFFRFENRNGLFLKGYAGQGAQAHGALNDEDFPGATHYSNTHSGLRGGELAYGAIDLGHE